jgi:hypothetical protein
MQRVIEPSVELVSTSMNIGFVPGPWPHVSAETIAPKVNQKPNLKTV